LLFSTLLRNPLFIQDSLFFFGNGLFKKFIAKAIFRNEKQGPLIWPQFEAQQVGDRKMVLNQS